MIDTIEPELLRPTPRPIRRRVGKGCETGCLRLFILPHMCAGVFFIIMALHNSLVLIAGQTVQARVLEHTTSHGKSTTYRIRSAYVWDGREYENQASVSSSQYYSLSDGDTVAIKLLPIVPRHGVLVAPGASYFTLFGLPWLMAVFWNGVLSLFVYAAYIVPIIHKRIVSRGVPTRGRIIDKRTVSGKSTSYYVKYEFEPGTSLTGDSAWETRVSAAPLRREMSVSNMFWQQAGIGDEVTVLYIPNKPKMSLIYRFAEYEVVH